MAEGLNIALQGDIPLQIDADQFDSEEGLNLEIPPSEEQPEPSTEGGAEENITPSTEGEEQGIPYQATQKVMGKGKGNLLNPLNWSKYPSALGQGLLDTATDVVNWATPGPIPDIPKTPQYESTSLQAWREISSLVLPFLILRGKATGVAGKIHTSKVAGPAMVKLGNNPIFQRFAKTGLDLGTGAFVDSIAETNKRNDTLATSWKRGKWWGHQLIPEAWTSDKLSPDDKARANTLEGMRLGFYLDVAFGLAKLAKAGGSVTKATKYLAEGSNQKALDKLVLDPLDQKVFDPDNPVLDSIARSEAKHDRELAKLAEINIGTSIDQQSMGIHKVTNELENGIRVKDSTPATAAVDQLRIVLNEGTANGRLGNMLTDAFRKAGSGETAAAERIVLKSLRDDLLKAGKYSVELPNGKKLSWKQIDAEGKILAEVIADPTLPRGDLVKILENFKVLKGEIKKLNPVGYRAVNQATKNYLDLWSDINTHKARGYFLTSEAGQISDMAEGARIMDGTDAIPRANEQILDRLELFDIESSIADFEWAAKNRTIDSLKAAVKDGNNTKLIKDLQKQNEIYDDKLTDIIEKAKVFRQTLQDIQNNNPEFANSLRLAYELSDGNVQSIKGLNHLVKNSFGTYSKSIIDGDPTVPSMLNRALMANVFNSMLSAFATPIRALTGNFGGFVSEPVSVFYGALREGDAVQLRRASHMYFGLADTMQQGYAYMGKLFRKASQSPDEVAHIFREDLALEKTQKFEFAHEFARAAAEKGELGPQAILNYVEELEAFGRNPVFRFSANAMTALDGFSAATQKVAQDKGAAFDILLERFPDGKWSKEQFQEVYENVWKKGWDENGLIDQESVAFARREIALNLDTPLVRRLNPLIKKAPILRSIFWFPTTQMNSLDIFGKYGLTSRLQVGTNFAGDYAELLGPYGNKKVSDFGIDEIEKILAKRGIDMSGDYIAKFTHLRNKVRGRQAMGNMAVFGAGILLTQGRIRGNGHWDPSVQKQRLDKGWRPMTWKPWGSNKWVSYEFMGPLAKWLALTVDGFDNFNSMSSTTLEHFEKKMGFILGAAITNDSLLGSMEPLFGILSLQKSAVNRWTNQMTNAIFPLAGWRNEIGKNLYGMLREVEYDDIGQIMRNRNQWLDVFDQEGALPALTDWASGRPIQKTQGNIWQRSFQNLTGLHVYDSPTPNSQFLIDIEFDGDPHFSVSQGGVEYTPTQRQELRSLLGQDGWFARRLTMIRKRAESMEYRTSDGRIIKGYVNIMHYARSRGLTSEDFEDYKGIKSDINRAMTQAKARVTKQLTDRDAIRAEEMRIYQMEKKESKLGDIEGILELTQPSSN